MFRPIIRMAAAALVAGAIALAISFAPAANDYQAKPDHHDTSQAPTLAKADRLRVAVKGTACSQHAWPNYEPKCQFDIREPSGEARTVRVIALR